MGLLWLAAAPPSAAAQQRPASSVELQAPVSVAPGQEFEVLVRGVNWQAQTPRASLSVSFPEAPSLRIVNSSLGDGPQGKPGGGPNALVYGPGQPVYNFRDKKAEPAAYPLAELYVDSGWELGGERFLRLAVTAPLASGGLTIQARLTVMVAGGDFANFPSGDQPDQQGLPVLIRRVSVVVPTATLLPATATTVPSATANPTQAQGAAAGPGRAGQGLPAASTVGAATPTAPPPTVAPPTAPALGVSSGPTPAPTPVQSSEPSLQLLEVAGAAAVLGAVVAIGAFVLLGRRGRAEGGPRTTDDGRLGASYGGPWPPSSAPPGGGSGPPGAISPPPAASRPPADQRQADLPTMPISIPSGYQIVGPPRTGGMASVYRAYQPSLGRHVALKMLSPILGNDPSFVHRFREEARRTALLHHPNIVTIYDIGELNGSIFIAMRWVDGPSLHELLARQGRLPLERAFNITAQLADALDYAHGQGIVHRDVKPGNVMLEPGDRVTLTDFGIAKLIGGEQLSQTGAIVGTPEYLAPEQAMGGAIDHRADLYALGVVLYEMLTGRAPFKAPTPVAVIHAHVYTPPPPPRELNESLPQAVATVVVRALAKDPGQRYQSGRELMEALRRGLGGVE